MPVRWRRLTALDLDVLPAAAASGLQPLSVQLGRSTCGPDDRVVAPVVRPRPAAQRHTPAWKQVVPRRVTAGLAHGDEHTPLVLTLGGLLVLAAGAGALDFRRHLGVDVVAEPGTVADARNAGLRTALLVVVLGLVAAWFFLPRSDVAAGPTYGEMAAGVPSG